MSGGAVSPQLHAPAKLSAPQIKVLGLQDDDPRHIVLSAKSALSGDKGRKGGLLRGLKRLGTFLSGSLSSSPQSPCMQQRAEASAHAGTLYYRGGLQDSAVDSIRLERSAHAGTVMHSSLSPDPLMLPSPVLTNRHPSRLSSLLKGHKGAESPPVMPHSPTTPMPPRAPILTKGHQRQPSDVVCNSAPLETVRLNITPAIGGPISNHAKTSSPVPITMPSFLSDSMSAGVRAVGSAVASTCASPLARSPPVTYDSQDSRPQTAHQLGGRTQLECGGHGSPTPGLEREPAAALTRGPPVARAAEPLPVPPQAPPTTTLLALNAAIPAAMRRRNWCIEDYQVLKRLYKGATSSVYKVEGVAGAVQLPYVLPGVSLRSAIRTGAA